MKKVLIIELCNHCRHFERNMYYGECCWHDKIFKPHPKGKIPKKISRKLFNKQRPWEVNIPNWCPLDDVGRVEI